MEDSWADVLVNRRWQHLASRLTAADCELLLQRASQRSLVVGGSRWVSRECATEGWALEAGLAPAARQALPQPADQDRPGSAVTRPGMARSLGSQKLAS